MSVTTNYARWALILLSFMILSTTIGTGLVVGAQVDTTTGIGAGLIVFGLTAGIGAKWMGED